VLQILAPLAGTHWQGPLASAAGLAAGLAGRLLFLSDSAALQLFYQPLSGHTATDEQQAPGNRAG
jgi:hypothetical protein